MQDRRPQFQIEAEHQPGRADHLHDPYQIGEGLERLQTDDDLTRSAGENFERTARVVGARVYQQRTGEPGMELSQLAEQRSLQRPTLDRVKIGHIALMDPERRMERPEQRHRIAGMVRHQIRRQDGITGPVAGLSVNRHAAGQIQHGNDLHGPYSAGTK